MAFHGESLADRDLDVLAQDEQAYPHLPQLYSPEAMRTYIRSQLHDEPNLSFDEIYERFDSILSNTESGVPPFTYKLLNKCFAEVLFERSGPKQ